MTNNRRSLRRVVRTLAIGAIALSAALLAFPAPSFAMQDAAEATIVLKDGTELRGKILAETESAVVMQVIDPRTKATSTRTFLKADIVRMDKAGSGSTGGNAPAPAPGDAVPAPGAAPAAASPSASVDINLPGVYVIPMRGQTGTDINDFIYKQIIPDIRASNPAILVIEMNCADRDELMISKSKAQETGLTLFNEFRELVRVFRIELRDIPQVLWVHDALGSSSMIAMAWPDVYMTSRARLGALRGGVMMNAENWTDADIRAKMVAAVTGIIQGFFEFGGKPLEVAKAMLQNEFELSASFKGRDVVWSLDTRGEYIVDASKDATVAFRARTAENLGLSRGTVDTLEDLMFLVGIREYRVIESRGTQMIDEYVKNWRKTLEDTFTWEQELAQALDWSGGPDGVRYLGRAKERLERILAAMNRYDAVELRWRIERGVDKLEVQTQIEILKERIAAARRGGGGGGGGGGRGGSGAGGMGN